MRALDACSRRATDRRPRPWLVVTLLLPWYLEAKSDAVTISRESAIISRPTVLVVDDEKLVLELVRELLVDEGYRVLAEVSGERALERAHKHPGPIHLLLSDVTMPGMNGVALARSFSIRRPYASVLFMSGRTSRRLPHPMVDKPFQLDPLLEAVASAAEASLRRRPAAQP